MVPLDNVCNVDNVYVVVLINTCQLGITTATLFS